MLCLAGHSSSGNRFRHQVEYQRRSSSTSPATPKALARPTRPPGSAPLLLLPASERQLPRLGVLSPPRLTTALSAGVVKARIKESKLAKSHIQVHNCLLYHHRLVPPFRPVVPNPPTSPNNQEILLKQVSKLSTEREKQSSQNDPRKCCC